MIRVIKDTEISSTEFSEIELAEIIEDALDDYRVKEKSIIGIETAFSIVDRTYEFSYLIWYRSKD